MKESKNIIGIWDLDKHRLSLGGLLLFLQELVILKQINQSNFIDVYFSGQNTVDSSNINLVKNIKGIRRCFVSKLKSNIIREKFKEGHIVWPDYDFIPESTLQIQSFFRSFKKLPFIDLSYETYFKAKIFLKNRRITGPFVSLHLKNVGKLKGESNADRNQWSGFLEYCRDNYDIVFIIAGSDQIDSSMKKLSNVIITADYNSDISTDLAIIKSSSFFMGMASGPCNIAILSRLPYVIFKDPGHHYDKMHTDLGERNNFPFSSGYQKILREIHTKENLIYHFKKILKHVE